MFWIHCSNQLFHHLARLAQWRHGPSAFHLNTHGYSRIPPWLLNEVKFRSIFIYLHVIIKFISSFSKLCWHVDLRWLRNLRSKSPVSNCTGPTQVLSLFDGLSFSFRIFIRCSQIWNRPICVASLRIISLLAVLSGRTSTAPSTCDMSKSTENLDNTAERSSINSQPSAENKPYEEVKKKKKIR